MKRKTFLTAFTALGLAATIPFTTQAAELNGSNNVRSAERYVVVDYQCIQSSELEDIINNIQEEIRKNCLPGWKIITLPVVCNPDLIVPGICPPETDNNQPGTDNNQPGTDNNQPGTDSSKPETDNNQPGATESSFAEQVVALVNAERAKAGLNPVTLDKNIEAAALIRARETETLFSHTRPNGSSFSSVLTENGISYRGAGENIAWGQASPEAVMNAWMNSSGHRANILNPNFTKIGVGYYQNAAGRNYWTQLFVY